MLTFIAELNHLKLWATDIGKAYLESYTKEKVYIKAGPEFGEREGHYLVIVKALYGLKSSGLRWHERFADALRNMDFFPSKAEHDIWMRDKGDHYKCIAVCVDDLLIASKDPESIISELEDKYHNKLWALLLQFRDRRGTSLAPDFLVPGELWCTNLTLW